MGFDSSRFSFNPWDDFVGVVHQQGRPQLDSESNEWLAEVMRRFQAGTLDTVGRAVYPATTPYAFRINASTDANRQNHLKIGAGRMYVDGILAENHGPADPAWDPALAELSGSPPGAPEVDVDYTQQKYYPGAALLPGNGPFLAILDVWHRAVTHVMHPHLVEKAIGVDTTGRLQTVWQVKLLDVSNVSGGVTCSTPDSSIQSWEDLIRPSGSRLTTGVVQSTPPEPCTLTSTTGYTGMQSQFYRVEMQQGGQANASGTPAAKSATFKWSRDNASVFTAVTAITAATNSNGQQTSQLTVESTGRDNVLCFSPGDWIEIMDDDLELNGQPGELHQIDTNGVDRTFNTITLKTALQTPANFPTTGTAGLTDPKRHTRIVRWDQKGKVYQSDGVTVWVDLDAAGTGDIPVPEDGTSLILENGITVAFSLNPSGSSFVPRDFWSFAARATDGSVEMLKDAPPLGIHHHYARLAVVTFGTAQPVSDCRIPWPSLGGGDCGCECTVTVRPGDLTTDNTLQTILDQYRNLNTSTVICLLPGPYLLNAPLRFTPAHSNITLRASREGAAVLQPQAGSDGQFTEDQFIDGLIVLDGVANVTLEGLRFMIPRSRFTAQSSTFAGVPLDILYSDVAKVVENLVVAIGVRPIACLSLTIAKCSFQFALPDKKTDTNTFPFAVGVFASGQSTELRLDGNQFVAARPGGFIVGFMCTPSVSFNVAGTAPAAPEAAAAPRVARATSVLTEDTAINTVWDTIFNQGTALTDLASLGGSVLPVTVSNLILKENSFGRLTAAAIIVGDVEAFECRGNEVDACNGGIWLMSPLEVRVLLADQRDSTLLMGLTLAFGYPLPGTDSSQALTVAPAPAPVRVYAGASDFTDSTGDLWIPDTPSATLQLTSRSYLNQHAEPHDIGNALPGSSDQKLYQSERYGNWTYTFDNLPNGYYHVTLKFAEITWPRADTRLFNVWINGTQVLTNLDIDSEVGEFVADDRDFRNIAVANSRMTIEFAPAPASPDKDAKVSAVQISAEWAAGSADALLGKANEFQSFFAQCVLLGAQGFAGLGALPLDAHIIDNQMQGLSTMGVLLLGGDQMYNSTVSALMMNGNRIQGRVPPASELTGAPVVLAAVTRCMVSANMILNNIQGHRLSLILEDRNIPTPEIAVMSNLFEGSIRVDPPRYAANSSVPSPMNTWEFLNTVIS